MKIAGLVTIVSIAAMKTADLHKFSRKQGSVAMGTPQNGVPKLTLFVFIYRRPVDYFYRGTSYAVPMFV